MSIIATAPVPSNGNLAKLPTIELPKIHTSHRKPEPATPCPFWCAEHGVGTPSVPADRTTHHTSRIATVNTEFRSGPTEPESSAERYEVRIWAERFDNDPQHDGHPVDGWPAVHMSINGYDGPSMNGEQAEQVARALLAAATLVEFPWTKDQVTAGSGTGRSATGDAAQAWLAGYNEGARPPSPVWPPETCPSWCSYADDPSMHVEKYGPVNQDDRTHLHSCYSCVPESDPNSSDLEPGTVELSLEPVHRYGDGENPKTVHQRLFTGLALHYREIEPTIRVGHFGEKPGSPTSQFDMTLGEAEQLAAQLAHLVELGRQG